jgi:hypothetical protein
LSWYIAWLETWRRRGAKPAGLSGTKSTGCQQGGVERSSCAVICENLINQEPGGNDGGCFRVRFGDF